MSPCGMVMAVGFAVGGDMHELGVFTARVEPLEEPRQESLALVEQPLEGHLLRHDAVIEEDRDRSPRRKLAEISA